MDWTKATMDECIPVLFPGAYFGCAPSSDRCADARPRAIWRQAHHAPLIMSLDAIEGSIPKSMTWSRSCGAYSMWKGDDPAIQVPDTGDIRLDLARLACAGIEAEKGASK